MRQPVRSVRRADHPDPLPLRLAIGVITGLGIVLVVGLIGHIGFRLGFAPLVRVPDLVGESGTGLATGTRMLIAVPRVVFRAGLAQPMWLMLAFAMIALPAAGLGAARPWTPGGPRMKPGVAAIASTGAAVAMLSGIGLIWWTGSPTRQEMLRVLPLQPGDAAAWYADIQVAAGLDALAVVSAALWVVLVFRLPIQLWLRALAASASFFTLVVVTVAMAISNAAAAQIGAPRALCDLDDVSGPRSVILGATPQHTALLVVYDNDALVQLRAAPPITITGRQSIVGYLEERRD